MTDLQILERLAKAEAESKRRLDAAENQASKILSDAKAEAKAIENQSRVGAVAFREKGLLAARDEALRLSPEALSQKMSALDSMHPVPNPGTNAALERLMEDFDKWIEARRVRK